MNIAICTLFEGTYHYGLGVLSNSLYQNGFRGTIWAGYRGELPSWANPLQQGEQFSVYEIATDCSIHFVPIDTPYHFANYKPNFMLELWVQHCPEAEGLIYFDPDIVVKCKWTFFEDWLENYVGLCEDLRSPLNFKSPKRLSWQKVLQQNQLDLPLNLGVYVNAGFLGLPKKHIAFVETWQTVMEIVGHEVESLELSAVPRFTGKQSKRPRIEAFSLADQDALNCAAMIHSDIVSIANKDAMEFDRFGTVMSHAIGPEKPWNTNYLQKAFHAKSVFSSHKLFWEYVDRPIRLYSNSKIRWKQFTIRANDFITNFYSNP